MKHHMKPSVHHGGDGGDAAVEDLNAKSLSAAKSGTSFSPTKMTPPAPKKAMVHKHHPKHTMHRAQKAPDASPAPEATPAPAPTDAPK
jgi:hypothetical protein